MIDQLMGIGWYLKDAVDAQLQGQSPVFLVVGTLVATYIFVELKHRHMDEFGELLKQFELTGLL